MNILNFTFKEFKNNFIIKNKLFCMNSTKSWPDKNSNEKAQRKICHAQKSKKTKSYISKSSHVYKTSLDKITFCVFIIITIITIVYNFAINFYLKKMMKI